MDYIYKAPWLRSDFIIERIMRVITAMRFAAEAGERSYIATPLTMAATIPPLHAALKIW